MGAEKVLLTAEQFDNYPFEFQVALADLFF